MATYIWDPTTGAYVLSSDSSFAVATDQLDYVPGQTVQITANFDPDATVQFTVAHDIGAGVDGIWGTADDLLTYDLSGTGVTWTATADASGMINTSWFVNQDALGQAFELIATEVAADGTATGPMVLTSFTDGFKVPTDINSSTDVLNLTGAGGFVSSGTFNGAIIEDLNVTGTGTGAFNTFLRVSNDGTEQGFNTNADPLPLDDKASDTHTHAIQLSDVQTVTVNGVQYEQFLLDIAQDGSHPFLSLDKLQIYEGANGDTGTLATLADLNDHTKATQVYDLGLTNGQFIALQDLGSGNGEADYRVLVPVSDFNNAPGSTYVYLYSEFGANGDVTPGWSANSSFEEWGVGQSSTTIQPPPAPNAAPGIDKQVTGDGTGQTWFDAGGDLTAPVILAAGQNGSLGSHVYFQSIVTNNSLPVGITMSASVQDVSDNVGPDFSPFAFTVGNAQTFVVGWGAGNAVTTDLVTMTALTGVHIDTATVTGTTTNVSGTDTQTASDNANYYGATAGITLDKQISGDGTTWLDQGNGNLSDLPVILAAGQNGLLGSAVHFKAIATNTSDGGLGVTGVSVTDASPSGTFSGATSITTNATYTLDTTAQTGLNTDTATVNGTVSDTFGNSTGVSASDQANYFGATAGITLDKQISGFADPTAHSGVNGGQWYDVGTNLTAPVILSGSTVYFEAIATNASNGGLGVTGVSVTDANPSGTFAGASSITTNATYTLSTTAQAGLQTDTATVNGTVSDTFSNSTTVTATDSANYYGATAGINVEKLVSVDGGVNWYFTQVPGDTTDTVAFISSVTNISATNLHIGTPTTISGANVQFEVVVTDTSDTNHTLNETFTVTDNVYGSFTFTSNSLTDGHSIVSNVLNETAVTGATNTDIATATGTVTDSFGNAAHPTDTDSVIYTGLALGTSGLTQGFWANHKEAWDGTADATWGQLVDKAGGLWGDSFTASSVAVTQKGSKYTGNDDIMSALPNHGNVLLGDANGDGLANNSEVTKPLTAAQALNYETASAGGNAYNIMMAQLVAAQLNIYNGDSDPGAGLHGSATAGHDLVGEAVVWLNAATTSTPTSSTLWTAKTFDTHIVDPSTSSDIMVSGQDIKNVLQAFDQDQIVTSKDGSLIGWSNDGGVTILGVQSNTPDAVWTIAHQHGVI